jgi:type I restriction enzyme S subunit
MEYIEIPTEITKNEVALKGYSLSASRYRSIRITNKNRVPLRELLDRPLKPSDKGIEVGSQSYISHSPFQFIRVKGIQPESFLPSFSPESVVPILPTSFKNYSLKEGDILISKDSNIGEVVLLDRDYPKHMISGGIYKLPITKKKYYIFGLLKSEFFKTQLLFLVSRGVTIKHAKTLFLDCEIPFPNQKNNDEVVKYIESLVISIINREKGIKESTEVLDKTIWQELTDQKADIFNYEYPTLENIKKNSRLDTGTYSKEFRKIDFLVKNYKKGFYFIDSKKIKSGGTPKKRVLGDSDSLKYLWITPTNITDFGTIGNEEGITCDKNNLNQNAMLLVNRTSRGGRGKYVGIAMYYDSALYKKAQYNQGIYRVFGYPDLDLIFMSCFMNSRYMREYCSGLSVGSKMKEIKASQFLEIPFPNFSESKKTEIANTYKDIISLHESIRKMKKYLEKIVYNLVLGKEIEIDLRILK